MGLLESIGFILALAVLAGFNLYLTVFLTGMAVRLDWFHWASQAEALQPFAHPLVIVIALILFLIEFGIDKIPWADSLWDSIHTFLRPAGAILLAVTALGPEAATFKQVLVGIGAGAAALLAHLAKAGSRLTINTSPEFFSNIIASLIKDVAVVGGFMLAIHNPLAALPVFGTLLVIIAWFTPLIIRSSRAILWLIWKKLRVPAGSRAKKSGRSLPDKLGSEEEILVNQTLVGDKGRIIWAAHCVTGKIKGDRNLPRHSFGHLVALEDTTAPLVFTGKRRFAKFAHAIPLTDCKIAHEEHFLSECLVIYSKKSKFHGIFRFHRGQGEFAERLVADVEKRIKAIRKLDPSAAAEDEEDVNTETGAEPGTRVLQEPTEKKPSAFPDSSKLPDVADAEEITPEASEDKKEEAQP